MALLAAITLLQGEILPENGTTRKGKKRAET